jgi:hypothetical protein
MLSRSKEAQQARFRQSLCSTDLELLERAENRPGRRLGIQQAGRPGHSFPVGVMAVAW